MFGLLEASGVGSTGEAGMPVITDTDMLAAGGAGVAGVAEVAGVAGGAQVAEVAAVAEVAGGGATRLGGAGGAACW